jgi:hypothetical protein
MVMICLVIHLFIMFYICVVATDAFLFIRSGCTVGDIELSAKARVTGDTLQPHMAKNRQSGRRDMQVVYGTLGHHFITCSAGTHRKFWFIRLTIADAAGNGVPFGNKHAEGLKREIEIGVKPRTVCVRIVLHDTMHGLCQWLVGDNSCCRGGTYSIGAKDKRAFSLLPTAHTFADTPVGNGTNRNNDEFTPDIQDGKAKAPSYAPNIATPGIRDGIDIPAGSNNGIDTGGSSSGSPPAKLPRLELHEASGTEESTTEDLWSLSATCDLTDNLNHGSIVERHQENRRSVSHGASDEVNVMVLARAAEDAVDTAPDNEYRHLKNKDHTTEYLAAEELLRGVSGSLVLGLKPQFVVNDVVEACTLVLDWCVNVGSHHRRLVMRWHGGLGCALVCLDHVFRTDAAVQVPEALRADLIKLGEWTVSPFVICEFSHWS